MRATDADSVEVYSSVRPGELVQAAQDSLKALRFGSLHLSVQAAGHARHRGEQGGNPRELPLK